MSGMTPREQHLSAMVDRALDLAKRERAKAVKTRVILSALALIEGRLERIEDALAIRPPAPMVQRHKGVARVYDDAALAALQDGPLSATEIARTVYAVDRVTDSQRATIRLVLQRLALERVVVFDVEEKTYALVPAPASIEAVS